MCEWDCVCVSEREGCVGVEGVCMSGGVIGQWEGIGV